MASLQEQLEQALNDIFDSCCDEESDEASIDTLARECVQKFATGKTQLTPIITKKLNASNEKTVISREQFLEKLTVWISEQNTLPTKENEITYEQNTSSDSSFSNDSNFIISSTPRCLRSKPSLAFLKEKFLERKKGDEVVDDHTPEMHQMEIDLSRERTVKIKLQDKTNVLENIVTQQEHRFQTIKETNFSLENRLTTSEQRNISLESELQRRNLEFTHQIERNQEENMHLANLVSELEEKLEKSNTKYSELYSENQTIKAELERCQFTESITKKELQLELDNLHRTTSIEIKKNETQIQLLNKELRKSNESEEELQKMITEYKKKNLALHCNEKELLETIGDLREEKRTLLEKIIDLESLENATFAQFNNYDSIGHDGELESIKSIFHETENYGALWGNHEYTDDRNQEENMHSANLISELEKKLDNSNTKYSELNSENQIIKAKLERCRCNELITKTQELQLELDNLHRTTSTAKTENESQIHLLNNELRTSNESEKELKKIIIEYKEENLSLRSNQKELLETIRDLREEKQALQEKINEIQSLKDVLDNLHRTTSTAIKENESQIHLLNKELRKSNESEKELQIIIIEYKEENLSLRSNQKELLETIRDLREEKQALQEKNNEIQSLKDVEAFATFKNDIIEHDEQQDSVNSVSSIYHETENYGALLENSEYTDDSYSQKFLFVPSYSQRDGHSPIHGSMRRSSNLRTCNWILMLLHFLLTSVERTIILSLAFFLVIVLLISCINIPLLKVVVQHPKPT